MSQEHDTWFGMADSDAGAMTDNQPVILSRAIEEACRRQANNVVDNDISPKPKGANVFLGIGLVTQNKISDGLGFGVIPMACLAKEVQGVIESEGLPSTITVLIADQHALNEQQDYESLSLIQHTAETVGHTTKALFDFLGMKADVVKASDSHWPTDVSGYVAMETNDILHAHGKLGCGVKIGWQTKRKRRDEGIIRDERWFDNQAKTQFGERLHSMSFLRTPEWMSLHTQLDPASLPEKGFRVVEQHIHVPYGETIIVKKRLTVNTSAQNLPLPPYFGEPNFHLGLPVNIAEEVENGAITDSMKKRFSEFEGTLKRTLGVRERTESFALLQELIDACTD